MLLTRLLLYAIALYSRHQCIYVAMGDKEGSLELLEAIEFWLPTYDSFLLLNCADVPYTQDAIRQESEEQRQRNHDAYIELFAQKHIPYILINGTLSERLKTVETILQEKLSY